MSFLFGGCRSWWQADLRVLGDPFLSGDVRVSPAVGSDAVRGGAGEGPCPGGPDLGDVRVGSVTGSGAIRGGAGGSTCSGNPVRAPGAVWADVTVGPVVGSDAVRGGAGEGPCPGVRIWVT